MKISVVTLGCKVNQCESDGIVKLLVDLGHEVSQSIVPLYLLYYYIVVEVRYTVGVPLRQI